MKSLVSDAYSTTINFAVNSLHAGFFLWEMCGKKLQGEEADWTMEFACEVTISLKNEISWDVIEIIMEDFSDVL